MILPPRVNVLCWYYYNDRTDLFYKLNAVDVIKDCIFNKKSLQRFWWINQSIHQINHLVVSNGSFMSLVQAILLVKILHTVERNFRRPNWQSRFLPSSWSWSRKVLKMGWGTCVRRERSRCAWSRSRRIPGTNTAKLFWHSCRSCTYLYYAWRL